MGLGWGWGGVGVGCAGGLGGQEGILHLLLVSLVGSQDSTMFVGRGAFIC